MNISLAILLIIVGLCLLVTVAAITSNLLFKTKNKKLRYDLDIKDGYLEMEQMKNAELYESLEYIRTTGKIPAKVMQNKYIFQNYYQNITHDHKIENIANKYRNLPKPENKKNKKIKSKEDNRTIQENKFLDESQKNIR